MCRFEENWRGIELMNGSQNWVWLTQINLDELSHSSMTVSYLPARQHTNWLQRKSKIFIYLFIYIKKGRKFSRIIRIKYLKTCINFRVIHLTEVFDPLNRRSEFCSFSLWESFIAITNEDKNRRFAQIQHTSTNPWKLPLIPGKKDFSVIA